MSELPSIDDRSFAAAQDFILTVKMHWTKTLYRNLKRSTTFEKIEETTDYKFFSWFERHLQRYKYSGRYGIQNFFNQSREKLLKKLINNDLVILDENLALPSYYTAVDIHQHPGGLWGDEIAGFVYEQGARSTTPLGAEEHQDLHHRLTSAAILNGNPKNILDMACGFGKSTEPFYNRLPSSDITGIDLSAPCLKLAGFLAREQNAQNVIYKQANAEATPFEKDQFDLVTSTMLLHELPPKSVESVFAEAYRVLEPGGRMVHLDFYLIPDEFRRFIHIGHSKRNNEPYMEALINTDLQNIMLKHGFNNITIEHFEEADGTLAHDYNYWRFPWTLICADKPS